MKRIFILIILLIIFFSIGYSNNNIKFNTDFLTNIFKQKQSDSKLELPQDKVQIIEEESVIIDVVEKVSPSVVTVSISTNRISANPFGLNPFDPFDIFNDTPRSTQKIEQDIGTGFVVSQDGMIVTNKHVVSDVQAKYKVITKDDKTYEVQKIFRDPVNDLAIIKINETNLKPVDLGDSSKLKVGQMAIAIGTALGEFRNTVTVGVISGMGRGITAGSPFEGYVERLDNVIQTDAAINPGNSGGPLLNSSGQVIGINTAVSSEGQNIGFALPINIVKESLDQFGKSGKFERPYLGVRYKMITRDLALLNEVPEGAYVQEVITDSPADKGGIVDGDIIVKIDNQKLTDNDQGLAKIIASKKVGDKVSIEIWRDGDIKTVNITIGEYDQE